MNRADKKIIQRLLKGGTLPTAYDPWTDLDMEICKTILTKSYDYTKTGGLVILEYEQD